MAYKNISTFPNMLPASERKRRTLSAMEQSSVSLSQISSEELLKEMFDRSDLFTFNEQISTYTKV